jgi:phosphate-selective porin
MTKPRYTNNRVVAVIMSDGRRIDLATIIEHGLTRSQGWDVEKVLWINGGWSWGKAWSLWDAERGEHVITAIGAGAYGDERVYTLQ